MAKVLNQHHLKDEDPERVYIGRGSVYGNPFKIYKDGTREEVIKMYGHYLEAHPGLVAHIKTELKGKDLVCFCAPLPCHGDILLEIAND